MTPAPSRAAVFSVAARSLIDGLSPSTTRILQCGQATEIIDTSRVASRSQPVCTPESGSGDLRPRWLTTRRQPLDSVHGGSPKKLRYAARYCQIRGVSNAIDTATVCRDWRLTGSRYADCSCFGV